MGKAMPSPGLFTSGDGPVIPSCNPSSRHDLQRHCALNTTRSRLMRAQIHTLGIYFGVCVCTGQLSPGTFGKSAPCYCLMSISTCTLNMSNLEEMSPKPSPAKAF